MSVSSTEQQPAFTTEHRSLQRMFPSSKICDETNANREIKSEDIDCTGKNQRILEESVEDVKQSSDIKRNVEVLYTCRYCIEIFLRKKDLKTHVKLNHPKSSRKKVPEEHNSLPIVENKIEKASSKPQHNEKLHIISSIILRPERDLDHHSSVDIKNEANCDVFESFSESYSKENQNEVSVIIDNSQSKKSDIEKKKDAEEEPKNELDRRDLGKLIDGVTKACKVCDLNFQKKVDLNKHLSSVHNVKQQRHRRSHSEIKAAYFCDVCNKGFTRNYDMLKHRRNQHKEYKTDSYKPERKKNELVDVCKVQDSKGNSVFKCDLCNKIFKQFYNLLRHRTIHTGDRAYFCEFCAKNFRTSSGLQRHINEFHHGIKKFTCEICDRSFSSRANRDEHMNIHTNTRPYVCDSCGKAFKQKASLHVHKTYHTDNFRFSCNICGNKYRRAQELKLHSWIHTGHKPHKCDICNASFRLNLDLKKHKSKGAFRCGECGELFCKLAVWETHLMDIHLIVPTGKPI